MDERLTPAPIPAALSALWGVFLQLAASRHSGMGAQPITLADLEAWCRLYGVRLSPWEIDTLLQLDAVALAAVARNRPRQ